MSYTMNAISILISLLILGDTCDYLFLRRGMTDAASNYRGLSLTLALRYLELADSTIPQGLYSLSGRTYYRKISWRLRFGLFQSLWHSTHYLTAALLMHVEFQSDTILITSNLACFRLHEILAVTRLTDQWIEALKVRSALIQSHAILLHTKFIFHDRQWHAAYFNSKSQLTLLLKLQHNRLSMCKAHKW